MRVSRRTLLAALGGALGTAGRLRAARQTGLEAFGAATLACTSDVTATPAVSAGADYRTGAPMRTAITAGRAGVPLALTGIVAGLSCGPIAGAIIEFWQPDASGLYDAHGFDLRGRQATDPNGRYGLTTIMPGAPAGRAPSIGVHVVVPKRAELWTALFFPGQAANHRDPRFRQELVIALGGSDRARTGTFDIRLNL